MYGNELRDSHHTHQGFVRLIIAGALLIKDCDRDGASGQHTQRSRETDILEKLIGQILLGL